MMLPLAWLTNAILCPVELLCEAIAVTEEELATPHVQYCSNGEVSLIVVLCVDCARLWSTVSRQLHGSSWVAGRAYLE